MPIEPELEIDGRRKALELWLFESALPLWWTLGADHQQGGFHDALSLDAKPVPAPRRLRVQARQIYVYATADRLGWRGPSATAVEHGLDWMLGRYRRPDGLYRRLVGAHGESLNDSALLYDQAFVLLALASAAPVLQERRTELHERAYDLREALTRTYWHDSGGFKVDVDEPPFQSNPHMHLFEAALSWSRQDPDGPWMELADRIADLCLERFIDARSGALREFFALDWSPSAGLQGRIVEPGHQFEWAWLLQQWSRVRGRPDAAKAARRLFEIGTAGVDPLRGVAQDELLEDMTIHQPRARLWPQTEWLKASMLLAEVEPEGPQRRTYQDSASAALMALARYLETPTLGLWRDKLDVGDRFIEEAAPATSFYHIITAIAELRAARILA